jgi:cytidylate kinase
MKTQSRSIELLVNEQLQKWQIQNRERKTEKKKPGPVITISREPGCGGSEIARKLARELNLDLAGQQIIQKVAVSAEMSAKVIASLDEKEVLLRDSWLESLFKIHHLWPGEYLFHLTKVIGTMGIQGNFIIVGRGAQYILPPEDTFRLRFIAPMEFRIANVMKDSESSRGEAEQYIIKTDSDRRAFIRKYFNADVTDPSQYDMTINTGKLGIEGSVESIKAAITVWMRSKD